MVVLYKAKCINNFNRTVEIFVFAKSEETLKNVLRKQNIYLISAKKDNSITKKRLSSFSLQFIHDLRQLIRNNVDLINSLRILKNTYTNNKLSTMIDYIIDEIEQGKSLSETLSNFECFDSITIKCLQVAEKTAKLYDSLTRIEKYLNSKNNISQKISEAVRYPLILASVVFSVLIFWIGFLVPKFAELFVSMNVELTILTRCVIAISNFLNSWISAFLCIFFIAILFALSKTNRANQILQIFFKRIGLTRLKFYIEFFYGMNLMLEEKLHLIECLEMFLNSENSDVIKDIVCMIKQGKSLATAMETSGVFRHTEISIIETGEQCGDLATSFCVAANNIKNNFETKSKKIIGILQPCLMLIIGGILILIICAIIIPIYSTLEYVNI